MYVTLFFFKYFAFLIYAIYEKCFDNAKKNNLMNFCGRNTANFHMKVSRETGDDNCPCHVTVFDNIAVARRCLISLAWGFECASD